MVQCLLNTQTEKEDGIFIEEFVKPERMKTEINELIQKQ